ncbi:hypothetical protein C8F04DRAFT_1399526 [Mycena alexandri]|uniref:Uncharacterized protein n=1 Tax=Mycena alexandri TaxID=1745969 RepID=A0AAD6SI84_9AGAR|nr:hypothetical protein C8F04DRAFT_1399526 [Mycena alexandri]
MHDWQDDILSSVHCYCSQRWSFDPANGLMVPSLPEISRRRTSIKADCQTKENQSSALKAPAMSFVSRSLLLVAFAASILPLATSLTVATGYKSVTTTDDLSSLATTSNFLIASKQFGTELNVGYNVTGDGNAVILYTPSANKATNQQWILTNVIGSPTQYTIASADAPTFLSFPGAAASTISYNGQTIVDATCYPTYTIQQVTPGENGYRITENTFGGILTAWAQYVETSSIGMATFQRSADLGAAQVWMIYAAPA